jgi:RNA polymerase sigma-70 factor (ECF subfamily)
LVIGAFSIQNFARAVRVQPSSIFTDRETMLDDEQSLVIRSRDRGERAAFEELVRRTARWLFARIYLETGGDAHRTDDLLQETFLRAWRSIKTLSDAKTFRPWLSSIAHSVVIDAARGDTRKKRDGTKALDDQAMLRLADGAPSPPQQADQSEQRQRVLAMLKELPQEYRDVLSLRYLAGADYETIAKQLAISNGSLRGLLSRGMKMLREKMTS